jgi:putative DNA primase/helicase
MSILLFSTPSSNGVAGAISATYPYFDEQGHELFEVVRFDPKDFRQRRRDEQGNWTWKLGDVRRVPYRLLDIIAQPDLPIFVVEGEKDADALADLGLVATTNPGGAGNFHRLDKATLARHFRNRLVFVLPDNDDAGRKHARQVQQILAPIAAAVHVVELPGVPPKGDISDWLAIEGNTINRLAELCEAATQAPPPSADPPPKGGGGDSEPSAQMLLNDTGNAERFAQRYRDELRHVWPWKKWLKWDGRRWKPDDSGRAEKLARVGIKLDLNEATQTAATLAQQLANDPDNEKLKTQTALAKERVKFFLASLDRRRNEALLSFARSELAVGIDDLNQHAFLLNLPNGTLDLESGKLRPHRRGDYLTTLCPTEYRPDAPQSTFMAFLDSVLPSEGLRRFVQQIFGLALIGKVYEHVLPIFWGQGRNGKSVLAEAIMATLGGDYAAPIVPDLLLARRGDDPHPTERASLFGKRIVIASETREGRWLNAAAVKQFTGGDKITARRMREDFWDFIPTHSIFLLTNNKPKVEGHEIATWSRLKLVPFTQTFYKPNELPPGTDPKFLADTRMGEKLAQEQPGILRWLVEGCRDWLDNGLIVPPEVEVATAGYRNDSDVVRRFLDECTAPLSGSRIKASDTFARFQHWLKTNGEESGLNQMGFGQRIEALGIRKVKNNSIFYCDLALSVDSPGGYENAEI